MKNFILFSIFFILCIFTLTSPTEATGYPNVDIYLDGNLIESESKAIIKSNRTLVPLRHVSETLGADIIWNEEDKTIYVKKGDYSVKLKLYSKIIEYKNGDFYGTSDIAPFLIEGTTFVPLRLISNALGVHVEWDDNLEIVLIDSSKSSSIKSFYDISINLNEEIIKGKETIEILIPDYYHLENKVLELVLIDRISYSGFIVGRASAQDKKIDYIPNLNDNGEKLLLINLYDNTNNILASSIKKVTIKVDPKVNISNTIKKEYTSPIRISPEVNFISRSIDYVFTNITTGKVVEFKNQDPYTDFIWKPNYEEKGKYKLKIIAYDSNNRNYISPDYKFNIFVDKEVALLGVRNGMNISSPLILTASRNFNVTETQYILFNPNSYEEIILKTQDYGSYTFFPGPEFTGLWHIFTRVKDTRGNYFDSEKIDINIDGSPKLEILGIGPNQIVDGDININFRSNVNINDVRFIFINKTTGKKVILNSPYVFKPPENSSTSWSLYAEGNYLNKKIKSETIEFKVYTKNIFGPTSIVAQNEFLEFVSTMAISSFNELGMSASLQTAQAILETGWGQYVPRDKYTGKKSNNLFGIKGIGPNGYVTSNTWEVYNGIRYRVDDNFRAYNTPKESWTDHKNFLLNSSRYKPVIDTMYDGYLSSWAIKTAGYATDPEYPAKLMRLMDLYDLRELDRVYY